VQECDVLKNFAFVHVETDEDAKRVMDSLDNHMLEGRPLHIEKSTSRLRKEPGMGDKCFRCGAFDHKTPNCPADTSEEAKRSRRRASPPSSMNGGKRPTNSMSSMLDNYPPAKRGGSPAHSTWGYLQPSNVDLYRTGGNALRTIDHDPELPRPRDRDLIPLFDQYMEARQRYFYYRDRLSKELDVRAQQEPFGASTGAMMTGQGAAYPASYTTSMRAPSQPHYSQDLYQTYPVAAPTGQTATPYYTGPTPQATPAYMSYGATTAVPPRMF